MKPIIGVMPLWDDEKDSIWMLPGYLDGISQAGGIPVIFPLCADEQEVDRLTAVCAGFLFTGGHDVSPDYYHEEPLESLVVPCRKRDILEAAVFRKALEADKPILGICRGIQFINAALGGTLYQDIPSQHPSDIEHRQQAPYDVPVHSVVIEVDSPLYTWLGVRQIPVNSCHHQAVKTMADGLKAMAVSPDGLTEALYRPDSRFLWAVQWHPEFLYQTDEFSRKIFRAFVGAAEHVPVAHQTS